VGIAYRKSALSQAQAGLPKDAPAAGDRFPWLRLKFAPNGPTEDLYRRLDDTCFNLLVIGQSPPADVPAFGGSLRTHAIPSDPTNDAALAKAKIPTICFYLLRPDGHVGLCGARLEASALQRYAQVQLHLAGQAGAG
jgi:hypothetical protein